MFYDIPTPEYAYITFWKSKFTFLLTWRLNFKISHWYLFFFFKVWRLFSVVDVLRLLHIEYALFSKLFHWDKKTTKYRCKTTQFTKTYYNGSYFLKNKSKETANRAVTISERSSFVYLVFWTVTYTRGQECRNPSHWTRKKCDF